MKDLFEFRPTAASHSARMWFRRIAAAPSSLSKRGMAVVLAGLLIPIGFAQTSAFAQDAPPPPPDQPYDQGPPPDEDAPPPQQWTALGPDQLNQLVAPIALYPDALVAQVLAASTYPTQVTEADRFVESQAGAPPQQIAEMADNMNWDPSVKALCAFPSVLSNMDRNLDWTTQLGNAYYNQPQDVMNAVQQMRRQAYSRGDLRSSDQLNVVYDPDDIVIEPANPAVVYVPYYDPWAIWGFRPWYRWYAPPPPPGWAVGVRFGFGVGIVVRPWGGWGWGWGHWGSAWGPHPYVVYNRVTYVSRSVTVINHGYYGRFDRAPEARHYNVVAAHSAYAAGERNGFNRGERNGYNNGFNNGYNRGANSRPNSNMVRPPQNNGNFNRPNNNYNRPNSEMVRPPRDNNNVNRAPGNRTYNPPPNNNNRPNNEMVRPQQDNRNFNRPTNQNRPAPRPEARPQGGGGERPHGGGDKGGDKGGHPHGR